MIRLLVTYTPKLYANTILMVAHTLPNNNQVVVTHLRGIWVGVCVFSSLSEGCNNALFCLGVGC